MPIWRWGEVHSLPSLWFLVNMFNVEGPWVWNIRNKGRDGRTVEKGMEYNGIELNKVNSKQVPILCQALHKGIWECMSIEDWDTGSIAKGVWSLVHHHQHSKLINAGREMLVQREILKGMSLKRLPGTSHKPQLERNPHAAAKTQHSQKKKRKKGSLPGP